MRCYASVPGWPLASSNIRGTLSSKMRRQATALEPPELVTEVKEELEKALNNYNI